MTKRGTWDEPVPQATRTRASEARKVAKGGRRLPGGVIGPNATAALDALVKAGYAPSATACIGRALEEAAGMRKRNPKFAAKYPF